MVYFQGNQIIYRLNGLAPRLVLNERQQQVLNGLLKVPLFLTKPFHQIYFVFFTTFIYFLLYILYILFIYYFIYIIYSFKTHFSIRFVRREKWPQFDP